MTGTLTVLGGSTPFTVEFLDVLEAAGDAAPTQLTLHGRDRSALGAVARYAQARLRLPISTTTELGAALDGADVVVHQIRYGGLEARAADARIAAEAGLPADETLGPAGLAAALRTYAGTLTTAREITARCPSAWVLNLTNPQGPALAAQHASGVERIVGVCELPAQTARRARERIGLTGADSDWCYAGFNHRGFVYGVAWLDDLLHALDDGETLDGVPARIMSELHAIPVKHFAMLVGGQAVDAPDRAHQLSILRQRALNDLARQPSVRPTALRERRMPWYQEGVLPALRALADGRRIVATAIHPDGLPREAPVTLEPSGAVPLPQRAPPLSTLRWLRRLERHERAVLTAAAAPSIDRLHAALDADPLVPGDAAAGLALRLWAAWRRAT